MLLLKQKKASDLYPGVLFFGARVQNSDVRYEIFTVKEFNKLGDNLHVKIKPYALFSSNAGDDAELMLPCNSDVLIFQSFIMYMVVASITGFISAVLMFLLTYPYFL